MKTALVYLSFIFRIIQQSPGDFLYFSLDPLHMTQSQAPGIVCPGSANDNFMLLIESSPIVHNMQIGEKFYLEGRDGERDAYIVSDITRLLAPGGANPWGNFVSEEGGMKYTALQAFFAMYCNPLWEVNIQTCYNGLNRMIVHAVPLEKWNRMMRME